MIPAANFGGDSEHQNKPVKRQCHKTVLASYSTVSGTQTGSIQIGNVFEIGNVEIRNV